jgi:excisionase family DNA binding protein
MLHITRPTAYKLIESGHLEPVRIRSAIRFRVEDIERLVERGTR